jgi:hypothetical protein
MLDDGSENYTCRGGQNVDRFGLSVRSSPTTSTGSALGAGSLGSFERAVDVAHATA